MLPQLRFLQKQSPLPEELRTCYIHLSITYKELRTWLRGSRTAGYVTKSSTKRTIEHCIPKEIWCCSPLQNHCVPPLASRITRIIPEMLACTYNCICRQTHHHTQKTKKPQWLISKVHTTQSTANKQLWRCWLPTTTHRILTYPVCQFALSQMALRTSITRSLVKHFTHSPHVSLKLLMPLPIVLYLASYQFIFAYVWLFSPPPPSFYMWHSYTRKYENIELENVSFTRDNPSCTVLVVRRIYHVVSYFSFISLIFPEDIPHLQADDDCGWSVTPKETLYGWTCGGRLVPMTQHIKRGEQCCAKDDSINLLHWHFFILPSGAGN